MSEKSTGTELPSQLDPLQLALKKVYSLHKEKIRELTDEKDKYKKGYDHLGQHKTRLVEKVQGLLDQNEILYSENTRLRNLLEDIRAQDGRGSGKCRTCEHLQSSVSAIQEAYKHSLEEKEKMIHYLEERLSETKQVPQPNLNLSNLLTPNKSFDGADSVPGRSPASAVRDKNGDSASTVSSRTMKAVTQRHCTESSDDLSVGKANQRSCDRRAANLKRSECFDEVDSGKVYNPRTSDQKHSDGGIAKTSHTRSNVNHCAVRDTASDTLPSNPGRREISSGGGETTPMEEEGCRSDGSSDRESPESARLRKLRLGRKPGKRSRYTEDAVQENKKHKFDNSHVHNTSDESDGPPAPRPPHQQQRSYHPHPSHILVQETCDPDTDRTASMSSDGSPEKLQRSRRSLIAERNNTEFGVVPETLGMGLTSSESESESDIDTQDTIRAKSVDGSPDDALVTSPSDVEDKMEKVNRILNRRSRTVIDRTQPEENSASRKDESRCDKSTSDHHKKGERLSDSVVVKKIELDNMNGKDMSPKPSSPVFSGVKGSRQSIESPFLFEEDRPGSSRSSSRRSVNMSGVMSDQESPLLLRPVEVVVTRSTECGQSPALKEAPRSTDVSVRTQERNHTDSEYLQAGRTSQERLQRTVHARNLRKAEKLKQTTLSQAFTASPPGLPVSPTKPEERAAIDKAIRLSLQEIHDNKEGVRTKKPLFVKSKHKPDDATSAENVPPVFKKPPSPRSLRSPSKRSPNKRSPNKKSPPKQKSDRHSRTQNDHVDVIDLDETVAPDSASLETFSDKGHGVDQIRKFPVNVLNESLDPDVSLTQYCSDTELLSQRPGLRRSSRREPRRDPGPRSASHSQGSQGASLDVGEGTCYRTKGGIHKVHGSRTHTDPASGEAQSRFSKKNKDGRASTAESGNEDMKDRLRTKKTSVPSFDSFNEGVSLDHDDYLADNGASKPSASVESGASKPSASVESMGPSLHTEEEENEADVTLDPKFMKAHMFQAQMDVDSVQTDSDSIPLSSRSFKFGSSKSSKSGDSQGKEAVIGGDVDDLEEEEEHTITPDGRGHRRESLSDSFDRVPRKQQAEFAYVDVVRKKVERQQLKASSCQECYEYYKSKGCSEEEIQQQIQDCSRHRARYLPPSTPEHFWSIGFPDTQECEERGYIRVESPSKQKPGYRRRRKLTKRFKSRGEEEEDSQTDTQK
ncbi:serine/arginine repetitive matrix protein 2-like [Haliotis cracherodii]|uniref:serine/arginine repetitive matrix protein 2-like n=1 Tax=Haliotis cracherodii TaxID=6455 RepID=UPI0039E75820